MMTARLASVALEEKIAKFVEFLVQDYLQTKGYEETGEKFVEECATRRAARDEGPGSPDTNTPTCATLDEAADWKFLVDKLALPVSMSNSRFLPISRGSVHARVITGPDSKLHIWASLFSVSFFSRIILSYSTMSGLRGEPKMMWFHF